MEGNFILEPPDFPWRVKLHKSQSPGRHGDWILYGGA